MRPRTLLAVFAAALGPASVMSAACSGDSSDTNEAGVTSSPDACGGELAAPLAASENGGPVDAAGIPDARDQFGRYPPDYCKAVCAHAGLERQWCKPAGDGGVTCFEWCLGRRPEGLARHVPSGASFSEMARLEAAAVPAFRILARELLRFGAPKKLVRAARRSARDEIRHARAMRALARRRGEPAAVLEVTPPARERSLEEIAIENAVEGCVRETWGALLAFHQAAHAGDAAIRATMKRIARDETEHASLSWRILAWSMQRLDRDGRTRVRNAMREASAELAREARAMPSELGLPDPNEQRRLIGELDRMLWS